LENVDSVAFSGIENCRSKRASEDSAGVKIDAVWTDVGFAARKRRVTMDNEPAVVVRRGKEWLTNPKEVAASLLVERDAWANAGVDEKALSVVV
jgi:hypothetical protein